MDLGLFIGLISIALALFFGLFFGLAGLRNSIVTELSTIKETVIAIRGTVEKTWDLILTHFPTGGGTVERELENLGKVKITAEPDLNATAYLIEIEKPILKEGLFAKTAKEPEFVRMGKKLLGEEGNFSVLSPHRMRYSLPCTDPEPCTEFVTFLLKWLNSTYLKELDKTKEFEGPILT